MSIASNIAYIQEQKTRAAEQSGRKGGDVLLVAVTKLHGPDEINEAIDGGITDIGENKVQEVLDKYEKVKPVRWHLIGHLQTNKVKYIIDKVAMIHSVDSFKLAEEIQKRAEQHDIHMDVLIQVNTAHEESKFGVSPDEVDELLTQIQEHCPRITVCGIMCIAPLELNPDDARPYFAAAREIYERYIDDPRDRVDFRWLSMGMTGDFREAIEEGSNLVRVGTAIFGNRDYRSEEK